MGARRRIGLRSSESRAFEIKLPEPKLIGGQGTFIEYEESYDGVPLPLTTQKNYNDEIQFR